MRIVAVDASSDLMPAVFAVRHQVFVVEQAVPPELERDEFDDVAVHLVALRGDEVIGTLRIVVSGGTAKIGRMAVLAAERKAGHRHAADGARRRGRADHGRARDIALHAQLTAKEFYARLGYREEGEVFEEAGIAHVAMRKTIG